MPNRENKAQPVMITVDAERAIARVLAKYFEEITLRREARR